MNHLEHSVSIDSAPVQHCITTVTSGSVETGGTVQRCSLCWPVEFSLPPVVKYTSQPLSMCVLLVKSLWRCTLVTFRLLLTLLGSLSWIRGLVSLWVECRSSDCTLTSISSPPGPMSFNLWSSISAKSGCVSAWLTAVFMSLETWRMSRRTAHHSKLCRLAADTQVEHSGPLTALLLVVECLYWLLKACLQQHFPCDTLHGKSHLDQREKCKLAIANSTKSAFTSALNIKGVMIISGHHLSTVMVIQSFHHQGRVGSAGPLGAGISALQRLPAKICPANRPSELELCSFTDPVYKKLTVVRLMCYCWVRQ